MAVELYKESKAWQILDVTRRMQKNRDRLLPYWGPEMTYGDARDKYIEAEGGADVD